MPSSELGIALTAAAAVIGALFLKKRAGCATDSSDEAPAKQALTSALSATVIDDVSGKPATQTNWEEVTLPIIVGMGGPSGSGKSSIAVSIQKRLEDAGVKCECISCDSYYISLPEGHDAAKHNFDEPAALELGLLASQLREIKAGKAIDVPTYDFTIHKRVGETTRVEVPEVLFVDGIFALTIEELRDMFDLRLYAYADADVCLGRRLRRDIRERGRDADSVITQYERFVKPAFNKFIAPSAASAHMLLPGGMKNRLAIDFIADELKHAVQRKKTE